jgi:hypothetical protein
VIGHGDGIAHGVETAILAASKSAPASRTLTPSRRIASIFVALAVSAAKTVQACPRRHRRAPGRNSRSHHCRRHWAGRFPARLAENLRAAVASLEPKLTRWVTNEDGGTAETYGGILTVAGVRYSFEVLLLADVDGAYSVANVSRFAPVEWSAGMQVT